MLTTRHKIFIARMVSGFLVRLRRFFFLPVTVIKKRSDIQWSLDLKEGIDLAIYLFGGFEIDTLRQYKKIIKPGSTVLDIGANIGAHTLPFAQLVGQHGKVIAFEPTQYAFNKLKKNLHLNPELVSRVMPEQMMLVSDHVITMPSAIHSSWPLDQSGDLHEKHCGRLMSTEGASKMTLDQYVQSIQLQQLDFIKLDVDGNEYDILLGAQNTLSQFAPMLIVELAPYTYEHCLDKFDGFLNLLWGLGYQLIQMSTEIVLPQDSVKVRQSIPFGCGMNVLATRLNH